MAVCGAYIDPLDLQCLFVNTFAGGGELFFLIAYLAIVSLAAFFRMSGFLTMAFIFIFTILVGWQVNMSWMLMLLWIGIGIGTWAALAKPWKN